MINGVNSYQQTQSLQQLSQNKDRDVQGQTTQLRDRDRDSDDTRVARTRAEALNKTNTTETTRDDRQQALQAQRDTQSTQAGGKDAAQRRGSLLDITA